MLCSDGQMVANKIKNIFESDIMANKILTGKCEKLTHYENCETVIKIKYRFFCINIYRNSIYMELDREYLNLESNEEVDIFNDDSELVFVSPVYDDIVFSIWRDEISINCKLEQVVTIEKIIKELLYGNKLILELEGYISDI